jgi:hypothetical protein
MQQVGVSRFKQHSILALYSELIDIGGCDMTAGFEVTNPGRPDEEVQRQRFDSDAVGNEMKRRVDVRSGMHAAVNRR